MRLNNDTLRFSPTDLAAFSGRRPRSILNRLRAAWIVAAFAVSVGCHGAARGLRAQAVPPVVAPESARFVASSRGTVYYPVQCEAWQQLSHDHLRFFDSEELARKAGYHPTTSRQCRSPVGLDRLGPLPSGADGRAVTGAGAGRPVGVCVVEHIVDGDTLDCRGGIRIRLLLVDAPEEGGDGRDGRDGRDRLDGLALRASLALEEMLPVGDSAVVALDVQQRDRYGRLLAHLYDRHGEWVNRTMVRRGYAVALVYPPNVDGVDAVRAAADSARTEGAGLWRLGGFDCLPVDVRAGRCGGGYASRAELRSSN